MILTLGYLVWVLLGPCGLYAPVPHFRFLEAIPNAQVSFCGDIIAGMAHLAAQCIIFLNFFLISCLEPNTVLNFMSCNTHFGYICVVQDKI